LSAAGKAASSKGILKPASSKTPKAVKGSKQKTLWLSRHCHWAMDVVFRAYGSHSVSGVVEMALLKFLRNDPETQAYMKRHGISEPATAHAEPAPEVEAP
jgi:hypothetical protein